MSVSEISASFLIKLSVTLLFMAIAGVIHYYDFFLTAISEKLSHTLWSNFSGYCLGIF